VHRYREFGLYSEADELLRRAFRDGFKRNGITFPAFLDALAWYRDRVRPGSDEASLVDAFSEFAAERGWTTEQRDAVLDVYHAVRDDGPGAVIVADRGPDQDRATLAQADAVLRGNPARYWADAELQDAVFEARERLAALRHPNKTCPAHRRPTPTAAGSERSKACCAIPAAPVSSAIGPTPRCAKNMPTRWSACMAAPRNHRLNSSQAQRMAAQPSKRVHDYFRPLGFCRSVEPT
jgi:hypothetical protein